MKKILSVMTTLAIGLAGAASASIVTTPGDYRVDMDNSLSATECTSPSARISAQGNGYQLVLNCLVKTSTPREGGRSQGNVVTYVPATYTYSIPTNISNRPIKLLSISPLNPNTPYNGSFTLIQYQYPQAPQTSSYMEKLPRQASFPFDISGGY